MTWLVTSGISLAALSLCLINLKAIFRTALTYNYVPDCCSRLEGCVALVSRS